MGEVMEGKLVRPVHVLIYRHGGDDEVGIVSGGEFRVCCKAIGICQLLSDSH